jgi:diguanylate cyclase (GGDEF)-like protein
MGVALARLERGGAGVAVMFLDLDRFKCVNDEFGHEAGDQVLAEVARRFAASVRPADTVARYGGDEFVVLCQDLWSVPDALAAAERLCRCLDDPVVLPSGVTAKVGVSVGVTLALEGICNGERLIRDADTASTGQSRAAAAAWRSPATRRSWSWIARTELHQLIGGMPSGSASAYRVGPYRPRSLRARSAMNVVGRAAAKVLAASRSRRTARGRTYGPMFCP